VLLNRQREFRLDVRAGERPSLGRIQEVAGERVKLVDIVEPVEKRAISGFNTRSIVTFQRGPPCIEALARRWLEAVMQMTVLAPVQATV
jgi:hypothetical protein